jgi:hypothetical protein
VTGNVKTLKRQNVIEKICTVLPGLRISALKVQGCDMTAKALSAKCTLPTDLRG